MIQTPADEEKARRLANYDVQIERLRRKLDKLTQHRNSFVAEWDALGAAQHLPEGFNPLRAVEREDKPQEEEVYIASLRTPAGLPIFSSRLASSFQDMAEKRSFIELALRQGEFYSVLVGISRTGRPDTNFIANELDYIAKFAIHKARKLEEAEVERARAERARRRRLPKMC